MKIAIVFYSMSGNTEYVANEISKRIDVDLIKIEPEKTYHDSGMKKFFWGGKSAIMGETPNLKSYNFNSNKYDLIIFGTPVWASNFTPPIRTFIKENKVSPSPIYCLNFPVILFNIASNSFNALIYWSRKSLYFPFKVSIIYMKLSL